LSGIAPLLQHPAYSVAQRSEDNITGTTKGNAGKCIDRVASVCLCAENTELKFDLPANQSQVTETMVEFMRKLSGLLSLC
jgi:hypothetical protein